MSWCGHLKGPCSTIRGLESLGFDLKVVYLKHESVMKRAGGTVITGVWLVDITLLRISRSESKGWLMAQASH